MTNTETGVSAPIESFLHAVSDVGEMILATEVFSSVPTHAKRHSVPLARSAAEIVVRELTQDGGMALAEIPNIRLFVQVQNSRTVADILIWRNDASMSKSPEKPDFSLQFHVATLH